MAQESSIGRLAVLGAGKMGGILIEAFVRQRLVPPEKISATIHHDVSGRREFSSGSIPLGTDNRAAARAADIILLCVKPQTVGTVLNEIRPELNDRKLLISIAVSRTDFFRH